MPNETVPPQEVLDATRQLAVLARLEYPLAEGLKAMAQDRGRWLSQVGTDIAAGDTLTAAVSRHPRIFSPFYREMVAAAEAAEHPHRILTALSNWLERAETVQRNVRTVLFYPLLLLNAAVLEVMFILLVAVPSALVPLGQVSHHWVMASVLAHLSAQALPAALLIALVGLDLVVLRPLATVTLVARLPGISHVQRLAQQSLWAQALGSLLAAGVALPAALQQAATVVTDPSLASSLARLSHRVDQGDVLSDALLEVPGLDPHIAWSVAAGEKREDMAPLLLDAAVFLDRQVDRRMQNAVRLLEPWAQMGAGLVVCTAVLTFWAPFYTFIGHLN